MPQPTDSNAVSSLPLPTDNLKAMTWAFGAAISVVAMVAMIKEVIRDMPTMELVFFRMLFMAVFWLPWALRGRGAGFKTNHPWLQLLRSVCGFTAFALMTYALGSLTLADATVLSFSVPLWMIPISFLLLREIADRQRVAATILGFAGVVMIVRPSLDTDPAMFAAVGSAIVTCITMITIKRLMRTDPAGTIILYYGIVGVLLSAIPAWMVWQTPTVWSVVLLGIASIAASAGQYCLARAYAIGDTTVVAPLNFSRLPLSVLAGLVIFNEFPDTWSIGGMTVILVSTIAISIRETRLRRREGNAAVPAG